MLLASHDYETVDKLKNVVLEIETKYINMAGSRPRQPDPPNLLGKRHQPLQHHLAPHAPPPSLFTALPEPVYIASPVQAQTAPPQGPRLPPRSCFGCGQNYHWLDRCPLQGRVESQSATRPYQQLRPTLQQTNQQTPQAYSTSHLQTIPDFRPNYAYPSEGASGSQPPAPAKGTQQQQLQGQ